MNLVIIFRQLRKYSIRFHFRGKIVRKKLPKCNKFCSKAKKRFLKSIFLLCQIESYRYKSIEQNLMSSIIQSLKVPATPHSLYLTAQYELFSSQPLPRYHNNMSGWIGHGLLGEIEMVHTGCNKYLFLASYVAE